MKKRIPLIVTAVLCALAMCLAVIPALSVVAEDEAPALINVAQNGLVTATPVGSTLNNVDWPDANMVDGVSGVIGGLYFVAAGMNPLATPDHPVTVEVAFGQLNTISSFEMHPFQYSVNIPDGYGMPTAYTIEASANGTDWTEVYSVTGAPEIGAHIADFTEPVEAAFVRINVTTYCTSDWGAGSYCGIGEFKVMGTPVAAVPTPGNATNVALNKLVTAEAGTILDFDPWTAGAMVDGVITGRGDNGNGLFFVGAGDPYSTAPSAPREVVIDLGAVYTLYSFNMYAFQCNPTSGRGYGLPTAYTISASMDGENYGVIYIGNDDDGWNEGSADPFTGSFLTPTDAQFVKITVTGFCPNLQNGIGEFEVLGLSSDTPTVIPGETETENETETDPEPEPLQLAIILLLSTLTL